MELHVPAAAAAAAPPPPQAAAEAEAAAEAAAAAATARISENPAPTSSLNAVSELPVSVKACSSVAPAKPTPQTTVFLSSLDLTVVFMVDSVYFYSTASDDAVGVITEALRQTLVAFYPYAGRLRLDEATQRLVLDCSGAGVLLAEAYVDVAISDLGDLSLPNPHFRNLVYTPQGLSRLSEWPLFTFQITRFKCGGFSLGTSTNHAISDGVGTINFMRHFATLARGGELQQTAELHLDRSAFTARTPPAPIYDFGDAYYKASEIPSTQSFSTVEDMLGSNLSSNYVVSGLVSRTFHFSKGRIESLKKQAMAEGLLKKCSTFDVVAAQLWKLRTSAKRMAPNQDSIMFMAVDVSNKLKPPLPKEFFGNRAFPVFTKLTSEELQTASLGFCVKLLQETIEKVDDEYVRSWIDWSEIHQGIPKFNGGFYLSSWWKFPFYDVDFGWGKPIYMGPVLTQRVEFALILSVPPAKADGGVDVLLTLSAQEMDTFENLLSKSTP